MPVASPIVTTVLVPSLSVTCPVDFDTGSTPVNYNQIIASMPSANYSANFFYVASPNCAQVGQVYSYSNFDNFGNQVNNSLPFIIEPYQKQCAAYFYPEEESVVFNGNSSINFTMLASQILYLKMYANNEYVINLTDSNNKPLLGDNLFTNVEKTTLGLNYFEDYCNYLIDNPTNA
jgi:hypothetical protein